MTKEVLVQYANTVKEIKETKERINALEKYIPRLEKRIAEIEDGETVKDKVKGGFGGIQCFVIEGIPTREYAEKKSNLRLKRELLVRRKETLELLEMDLLQQVNEIVNFITGIKDSHIRRIVHLRVVDGYSWNEVADRMGGGNTEGSVKMAFHRFIEENA